jgi:hypothetical protein
MPNRRDAKPKKGVEARIPFLRLVTVVTASYYFEPIRWRNAKRMYIVGMQITRCHSGRAQHAAPKKGKVGGWKKGGAGSPS